MRAVNRALSPHMSKLNDAHLPNMPVARLKSIDQPDPSEAAQRQRHHSGISRLKVRQESDAYYSTPWLRVITG